MVSGLAQKVPQTKQNQTSPTLAQTPKAEADNEIELGEVLRPTGLSTGKDFGSREIFQVLVVHDHIDRSTRTFEEVSPDTEGFKDGKEFLVKSIVVEFRSTEGAGMESHGVDFPGVSFNRQDGSESVVGGISLNNDGPVWNPMGQDRRGGECGLQGFKGLPSGIGEVPSGALTGEPC